MKKLLTMSCLTILLLSTDNILSAQEKSVIQQPPESTQKDGEKEILNIADELKEDALNYQPKEGQQKPVFTSERVIGLATCIVNTDVGAYRARNKESLDITTGSNNNPTSFSFKSKETQWRYRYMDDEGQQYWYKQFPLPYRPEQH